MKISSVDTAKLRIGRKFQCNENKFICWSITCYFIIMEVAFLSKLKWRSACVVAKAKAKAGEGQATDEGALSFPLKSRRSPHGHLGAACFLGTPVV